MDISGNSREGWANFYSSNLGWTPVKLQRGDSYKEPACKPSEINVNNWKEKIRFEDSDNMGVKIKHGEFVIDLHNHVRKDTDKQLEFGTKWLCIEDRMSELETPIAKTRNGGFHLFFKTPEGYGCHTKSQAIKGFQVDVKSGSSIDYLVVCPTSGYSWLKKPSTTNLPIEPPSWIQDELLKSGILYLIGGNDMGLHLESRKRRYHAISSSQSSVLDHNVDYSRLAVDLDIYDGSDAILNLLINSSPDDHLSTGHVFYDKQNRRLIISKPGRTCLLSERQHDRHSTQIIYNEDGAEIIYTCLCDQGNYKRLFPKRTCIMEVLDIKKYYKDVIENAIKNPTVSVWDIQKGFLDTVAYVTFPERNCYITKERTDLGDIKFVFTTVSILEKDLESYYIQNKSNTGTQKKIRLSKILKDMRASIWWKSVTSKPYEINEHILSRDMKDVCSGDRILNIYTGLRIERYINLNVSISNNDLINTAYRGCDWLLNHLLKVWCAGNKTYYDYLMDWFAFTIHSPKKKLPFVPVVISDTAGVGKSCIADFLTKYLFGTSGILIDDPDKFMQRFNSIIEGKRLIVLDNITKNSVLVKKDGKFKSMISSDTVIIEPKHVNAYNLEFMLFSNYDDNILSVFLGERRFFMLEAGNAHLSDRNYFRDFFHAVESCPDLLALNFYNLTKKLEGRRDMMFRKPPATDIRNRYVFNALGLPIIVLLIYVRYNNLNNDANFSFSVTELFELYQSILQKSFGDAEPSRLIHPEYSSVISFSRYFTTFSKKIGAGNWIKQVKRVKNKTTGKSGRGFSIETGGFRDSLKIFLNDDSFSFENEFDYEELLC